MKLDILDYILIGMGILLLPVMMVGLVPIGIAVWRLGHKWQIESEKYDRNIEEIDREIDELTYEDWREQWK